MTVDHKHSGAPRLIARWSLLLAAGGAVLVLVGVSTVRESYREWKVDQEIRGLENEVQRLEGRKLKLTELIDRLEAPESVDREARARLGMRKIGERVFVLRGADASGASWTESLETATPVEKIQPSRSNPEKWLAYFFLHE